LEESFKNKVDNYEQTVLHEASKWVHIEVVKALLSHPKFTNVNQADSRGRTALHLASGGGHIKVVKAILSCKSSK